ncbi:hypothetical protein BIV57_00125 [Mangrovactinospora gilvigrisea]|uniref:Protein kinase domain-containing protein n=1 Tax=Mangrovactinospora gilvigrisea TaxID=1428644 RepID=A0A1J7C0Q9_9ACTN|nr:aminoglycoside phosphotransferase family protein [Mangrovactinospora gilvigrisea]OIV39297.1 hypothetical protein BIV57_00125 [Mangrovactinospora gilvigrisea]
MADEAQRLPAGLRPAVLERLPAADLAQACLIGEGIATRAYQINDPSGPWVARVARDFPHPWRRRGGRSWEVPLLHALAARGLPVPRDPFAIAGAGGLPVAIVERRVAGRPPASPPHGEQHNRLARQLAEFLTGLHHLPVRDARSHAMTSAPVAADARQHLATVWDLLTEPARGWLDEEISSLEGQEVPQAVVHRDVRAEHLYLDARGDLVGVIDFGDATLDDPALDFAKIAGDFGQSFLDLLLSHYRGPAGPGVRARARRYRRLELLWEAADDAWGEGPTVIRRLESLAAAAAPTGDAGDAV